MKCQEKSICSKFFLKWDQIVECHKFTLHHLLISTLCMQTFECQMQTKVLLLLINWCTIMISMHKSLSQEKQEILLEFFYI